MRKALGEHLPEAVEWQAPTGGLYFWARMPRRVKTGMHSRLFKAALANEVLYVPGQLCYANDPTRPMPNREMRLSYGGASEANLRAGLARLGKALQPLL